MRALSINAVPVHGGNIGDFSVLPGHITFEGNDRIVWTISKTNRRAFGEIERQWLMPYQLTARRLRGTGHQVHVAIQAGPDPERDITDIWLRRAKDFPI